MFTTSVFSQVVDTLQAPLSDKSQYKQYIGLNVGATTGIGFAYRYWPNKHGVQITFLPIYDDNNTYVSFGLTYLKEFKKSNFYRSLFYVGNHITNFIDDEIYDNIGFGVGFEFFRGYFSINFMVGYAGYNIFYNLKTRPTGEVGIFYNF